MPSSPRSLGCRHGTPLAASRRHGVFPCSPNLLARACKGFNRDVTNRDGLQPNSHGLQPSGFLLLVMASNLIINSDGLQPSSTVLSALPALPAHIRPKRAHIDVSIHTVRPPVIGVGKVQLHFQLDLHEPVRRVRSLLDKETPCFQGTRRTETAPPAERDPSGASEALPRGERTACAGAVLSVERLGDLR